MTKKQYLVINLTLKEVVSEAFTDKDKAKALAYDLVFDNDFEQEEIMIVEQEVIESENFKNKDKSCYVTVDRCSLDHDELVDLDLFKNGCLVSSITFNTNDLSSIESVINRTLLYI